MTSRDQELKALEQIKKIVEDLGEGSYLSSAFEGCFELAEKNIEFDASFSLKEKAESLEKELNRLELDNRDLRAAISKSKESSSKEIMKLTIHIEKISAKILSPDDITDCIQLVKEVMYDLKQDEESAANRIVLYAEKPDSDDFRQAVIANRRLKEKYDYYNHLLSRLERSAFLDKTFPDDENI